MTTPFSGFTVGGAIVGTDQLVGLHGSGAGSNTIWTFAQLATYVSNNAGIIINTTPITGGTTTRVLFDDAGVVQESAGLTFTKGNGGTTSVLTIGGNANLLGEAANVLAQRNGTTAQKARWYNSWTDASNGSWAEIDMNTSATMILGSNSNGSGAGVITKFRLNVDGANRADFGVTTAGWSLSGTLGVSSGLTANSITSLSSVVASGNVATADTAYFHWASRSVFASAVDGDVRITSNNLTSFGSLLLGPSGTTYNRLKHEAAGVLGVWLADASARSQLYAGTVRTNQTTVANLPAASTAGDGARAYVTDASTTLILGLGGTVAGGGANHVPVYSDGTNWIYG